MQTATRESLKAKNVSPSKLAAHLSGYRTFRSTMRRENKYLADCQEDLKKATSIDELFVIVSPFWSFLDYDILEDIIAVFGSRGDKGNLRRYVQSLKKFLESWKIQPHKISRHRDVDSRTKLYFKLDTISMSPYRDVKEAIARILNVETYALQLCSVDNGCVELVFWCSDQIPRLHNYIRNKSSDISKLCPSVLKVSILEEFHVYSKVDVILHASNFS